MFQKAVDTFLICSAPVSLQVLCVRVIEKEAAIFNYYLKHATS